MATINGAKALQLDSQIGSVEVGKVADLIAINMRCIEAMPVHNLFSSIVYASGREQYVRVNGVNCRVTHVWVGGKALMEDGELTTIHFVRRIPTLMVVRSAAALFPMLHLHDHDDFCLLRLYTSIR